MDLNEIYTELWGNNSMVVYHPSLNDDGEQTMLAIARYSGVYRSLIEIEFFLLAHPNAGRKYVHVFVRELCFDFIKQKMNEDIDEHRD